jgi:hypothetical protein
VGEASSDPAIGLLLGTETKTERFSPVSLAALSTENFGAAVEQMARYKQLTCPEEIAQEKDEEEWRIQVELTAGDLGDIDSAASHITVEGARYPERLEKMTGL